MNKKLTTRIALTAAMAFAVGAALTACGSDDSSPDAGSDLDLVTAGKLTMALRTDDKPVSFIENGKPAGFLVDFTTAMADEMGLKPEYVSTDFDSMLPNVKNHLYDTAAFNILITDGRKDVVDFTTDTGWGEARLVSKKKAPFKTVEDAAGKTIAITKGSELIPLLEKRVPTVTVKEFPNIAASGAALEADQVDGLFSGPSTVNQLLSQHDDFTDSELVETAPSAYPVAKDHEQLRSELDSAITKLMKDGTYTELFDKWYDKDQAIPQDLIDEYDGMTQRPGV